MKTAMDERWSTTQEYVGECKAITWDTCHKIYVLMDDEQVALMREYGYEEDDAFFTSETTSPEQMMTLLRQWYEDSCGLRFINAVATVEGNPNDGFTTLIGQFDDEEDSDEEDSYYEDEDEDEDDE